MRKLTDHKLNGLNEHLDICVMDEAGNGGANHQYHIHLLADPTPGTPKINAESWTTKINFQNGPILEAGVNGLSNEVLLAIIIDRLRGFQGMEPPHTRETKAACIYACRDNAVALTHCEDALMWLQKRTRERMVRGVEGTSTK